MVAAGATVLMAASEESSSDGIENNSASHENQVSSSPQCNNVQTSHRANEYSLKKTPVSFSSSIKSKSPEKNSRITSKVDSKDGAKSLALHKTLPIRETKASRLRAASILSPSGGMTLSRKLGVCEAPTSWNHQPGTSLSVKEESPMSSDNSTTISSGKERDKSHKRKSYLNRSLNTEAVPPDRASQLEYSERSRSRRQSNKQDNISETMPGNNTQRKSIDLKVSPHKGNSQHTASRLKTHTTTSSMSTSNTRLSSRDGHSDSEVSRRVDALTALTRATMERVERLTASTNLSVNHGQRSESQLLNTSLNKNPVDTSSQSAAAARITPASPSKYSILKKPSDEHSSENSVRSQPVSILKHSESGQSSSNTSHTALPVTFSPSVVEPVSKRHGILKKRSSLDESEILRRRSCSPDVSFADNSYSEFRPILKNQRRSSLDELIKRDQSPDTQPTSILKRKSSREDDREDRQMGSPEPQSILKRKSVNTIRTSGANHHVTITADFTLTSGNETIESSEVRPILKKKHSREESSLNDISSVEPRPILKKKSSTESDEHDDRPKKTILKCSKKNSQEDCNYETELGSPKKLSMLRNRVLQCRVGGSFDNECVKPILKQSSARDQESRVRLNVYDTTMSDHHMCAVSDDLFLRKRAQSVGHLLPSSGCNEFNTVLSKRRSLESTSFKDVPLEKARSSTFNNALNGESYESEEIGASAALHKTYGVSAQDSLAGKSYVKEKYSVSVFKATDSQELVSVDSKNPKISIQATDSNKESVVDFASPMDERQEEVDMTDFQENCTLQRSNSVSKMAMHFKALQEKAMQEKARSAEKEAALQRSLRKESRGMQRYRERKEQCSERFNTQPVTLQEVQEAVLQNQRKNTEPEAGSVVDKKDSAAGEDEFDPSKLSLAERVRLFNQKIATESSVATAISVERQQRRRPAARYRTQPITSEEVEVASRISPLNADDRLPVLDNYQKFRGSNSPLPTVSHPDVPKGILKSSTSQTHYVSPRSQSPELEGLKLIKSVLKKESEELHQQTSENCDILPRSILKADLKSEENSSSSRRVGGIREEQIEVRQGRFQENEGSDILQDRNNTNTSQNGDECAIEVASSTKRNPPCAYGVQRTNHKDNEDNETKQRHTVPSIKNTIAQGRSYQSKTNNTIDNVDVNQTNIEDGAYAKRNNEKRHLLTEDAIHTSGDETSSSGGREVHSIIKNEAVLRRRQASLAKQARYTALSKSASHHALGCESQSMDTSMQKRNAVPLPGLCRSATQAIPTTEIDEAPSMSIAERLAALQRSGSTNWKKRIAPESVKCFISKSDNILSVQNRTSLSEDIPANSSFGKEDVTIKQGVLADRLGKLESATEGWKKRIAAPDVLKFSVAGRMKMENPEAADVEPTSPLVEVTGNIMDRKKKTPRPERFRSRRGYTKDASSTPTSPSKDPSVLVHGSFSEPASDDSGEESKTTHRSVSTVSVPKADDETFMSFFTGISVEKCRAESLDLAESDFDMITSQTELLVHKRTVQTQRRRVTSRNPLRALAARTDIKSEYTEIRTGVAEKVMKSLNVEKLAKNSTLAVEALAGLASTEDFSAITLRNVAETDISVNKLPPYKDLMLILIKGRRHVQVRLIEPIAENINSGDNYVLVTKSEVYNYIGRFSNVIEKARGAEIALSIQQNKDLGCQASQVITISEDKVTCTRSQLQKFWKYLGVDSEDVAVIDSGHPDEDELYESAIIDTNMVYEIKDEELIPLEKYWGTIPKIEMLDPSKILVFDFGSEMYIWTGKNASNEKKKLATKLATEMWEEGYDYTECTVCPVNAASMIGRRGKSMAVTKTSKERPTWCLLAKVTQHVETILFREKFLDWPNVSGIIRVKGSKNHEKVDGTIVIEPCSVNDMIAPNDTPVDLILEGSHLGRGSGWYDNELMKQFVVTTTSVTVWHIDEFSHTLLSDASVGQFCTGDSYIVRWLYSVTITGRELNGQPSKHSAKGRDRSAYFIWQGQNASLNEQGAAALLTVELDDDQGPQIRVVQGYEPAAFLNLFNGRMIVHAGKRADKRTDQKWRLYICRGTLQSETSLIEIPCSTRQLRSRGCLILLNIETGKVYVWYGANSLEHIRKNALNMATKLKEVPPAECGFSEGITVEIYEINEGKEPEEFFDALGGANRKLYLSLAEDEIQDHTPRVFHLSSISKEFKATEVLCPHRAELPTPFPFLQDDLYQASQPALFLLDNKNEIWIWQGWWPDTGAEDQSGSKAVRWQAERRVAMTMAMQYWQTIHPEARKIPVYLVWAGLEPLQFINLFPTWTYRDDIAELNIEVDRNPGEVLSVENELARLTQSTYPPAQLLQRPLPEGVDPTHLEQYLSPHHFKELLGMNREDFEELPAWKQVNLKKEIGLF